MTTSYCLCRNGVVRLLVCAAAVLSAAGCERPAVTEGRASDSQAVAVESAPESPLLLEDEPALLLDDADAESESGPSADNSRCFVCHINYMQEELAVTHARKNVGCAECHGPSDAHIADESWGSGGNGTAPDIMYPPDRVNPACMACHPKEKIDTPQHAPLFAGVVAEKVCTDCHGDHRLPQRRCKWK